MKTKQEAIEIRRIYAETGCNVSETARRCSCGRDTVRRVLRRDYENNEGRKHRHHEHPEDAPIEEIITENLSDAMKSRKLRLTATRIARIVQADGCKLSERQLLKRVAVVRKRITEKPQKDVYLELDAPRGAYQVDFGQYDCYIDGAYTIVHGLLVSSAFSNAFAVVACMGEDSASLFDGLERCFEQLGGVPPILRFDNLAPAVFWDKKMRSMTEPFSRFVVHHGFRPEFCNPRSGWEKGNVENKVKYVRNNFFNPLSRCRFDNFKILNDALSAFAIQDRQRKHYKKERRISELLDSERPLFGELHTPFGYVERRIANVDKQGFVQYRGNRYFTKHDITANHVIIEATVDCVEILDEQFNPVAHHKRTYGKNRHIQPASDLALMLAKKPSAIPYVIKPIEEAVKLREHIRGKRAVDRIEPIMQFLTNGADVSCLNEGFKCSEYIQDLNKYDKLAGLNEQTGRNSTTVQQITPRLRDPGNGAGVG